MSAPSTGDLASGPKLPPVELNKHTPRKPGVGHVVANERCTERKSSGFTRHISIDVSGTELAGRFRSGQSFGVLPPGEDENGKPHKLRLYSIASPSSGEDGNGQVLATTVKRTIDEHWKTNKLFLGVASNYLCDLQVGDEVRLTGPAGKRFLLPDNTAAHDYLFFATGTGIAPFRGMLRDLLEGGCASRVTLVVGSPYSTDLPYHGDMLRLQREHENFLYLTALSREPQSDGHDPMYVDERLETHQERFLPMLESERTLLYICGLSGMEIGIFRRMATMLPDHALSQYLDVDADAISDIRNWDRKMLHKKIRPTGRVFTEVY